jgi:hypothetical protein
VQRLKEVFSSVGASSEDITPSTEDIPNTFKHIENVPRPEEEILVVRYEKRDNKVCCQMRELSEDQGRTSEARRFVAAVADYSMQMG